MQEVSSLSGLELLVELDAGATRSPKQWKGRQASLVVFLRDSAVRITPCDTGIAANIRTWLTAKPFE